MMNKKIFDILPPRQIEKKIVEESFLQKQSYQLRDQKIKSSRSRVPLFLCGKKTLIFISLILVGVGFFYFFTPTRAEIKIWPKTEHLIFETELIVNKQIKELDFLAKIIPAKIFEVERLIKEEFTATGSVLVERRAGGILWLYNYFSTTPQTLVARTRFVSADGKLFRTPERVVIPGKRYERGELIPGKIEIKVIADQPGEEFNIGPSRFSIPGFVGTARFIAFYGRSFEPMTGGKLKEVAQVNQRDLDQAKGVLKERAITTCFADLKEAIPKQFSFLEEAFKAEVLENLAGIEVGVKIEKFDLQTRIKCQTLAFKREDIRNFAMNFITAQIVEGKAIVPESLKIDHSFERVDIERGEMALYLTLIADVYSAIDQLSLQKGLVGKSLTEAQVLLENMPQINKVYIEFWPFWLKNLPENLDKISVELKFD